MPPNKERMPGKCKRCLSPRQKSGSTPVLAHRVPRKTCHAADRRVYLGVKRSARPPLGRRPRKAPKSPSLKRRWKMQDQWFYSQGGHRSGPVALERLRELAASGVLQPTDLVSQGGTSGWRAAVSIDGLFPPA